MASCVYLPADNRLDYGRFLTSDIAEIQVAKGYARSFTDHWDLSNGFMPNATDEYASSYTYREGSKGAPLHISDTVESRPEKRTSHKC